MQLQHLNAGELDGIGISSAKEFLQQKDLMTNADTRNRSVRAGTKFFDKFIDERYGKA